MPALKDYEVVGLNRTNHQMTSRGVTSKKVIIANECLTSEVIAHQVVVNRGSVTPTFSG